MVQLPKPQLIWLGDDEVSEHNRGPLSISPERIETKQRMANGKMRKYVVADKNTFSVSWTGLPHDSNKTVDGKMGADGLQEFFDENAGEFTLTIKYDDARTETFTVMFSEFSREVTKRGSYDFWDVSITLEEV